MNISLSFIRGFLIILSILFLTTYTTTVLEGGFNLTNALIGIFSGLTISGLIIGTDALFNRFNLKSFNVAALGLFFGFLMGKAIFMIFGAVVDLTTTALPVETITLLKAAIFLFTAYFGMVMTARASEELYVSIPFVKFKPTSQKKKDVLIDASILMDTRIIDLASSGLLDNHLIIPRFAIKELYAQMENGDDSSVARARRCLDVLKKLEAIQELDVRYVDVDFPEIKDSTAKLVRLARLLESNIITADISRIQQSAIEGIRIINIHTLSNALKPVSHTGEYINIKIQRYGKEPRQGVGYLDDGTMVVVNGGAEYIGDTIKAQVLSVKHTTSGRMIFCNATDDNLLSEQESAMSVAQLDSVMMKNNNSFFAQL